MASSSPSSSPPPAPAALEASWDLMSTGAVKDFLALGRPVVGWAPLLERGPAYLTALTLRPAGSSHSHSSASSSASSSSRGRLVLRQGAGGVYDALACAGLGSLPLRALDCVFLMLTGAAASSPREEDSAATAADLAAEALADLGRNFGGGGGRGQNKRPLPLPLPLVFVVGAGRVSAPLLARVAAAAAPWGLGIGTLRQLTAEDLVAGSPQDVAAQQHQQQPQCARGPRVVEMAWALLGGGQDQSGQGPSSSSRFFVVQLQQAAPGQRERTETELLRMVETSLYLAQPPSPPHEPLTAADAEYLRPPPPHACALHLPNYHDDWRAIYPQLQVLLDSFEAIRAEALGVPSWIPWPEYHFRDGGTENDWRVVPFLHTFPATDPTKSKWIASTAAKCPETVRALQKLAPHGLRTALFSRLGPDTRLSAHTGWEDLANFVLRVHLTLTAPAEPHVCGTWVEGEVRYHRPGEIIVFDDSKVHKAFNLHPSEARLVLIVDMARPAGLAPGVAVGGHTEELDAFISAFT